VVAVVTADLIAVETTVGEDTMTEAAADTKEGVSQHHERATGHVRAAALTYLPLKWRCQFLSVFDSEIPAVPSGSIVGQ